VFYTHKFRDCQIFFCAIPWIKTTPRTPELAQPATTNLLFDHPHFQSKNFKKRTTAPRNCSRQVHLNRSPFIHFKLISSPDESRAERPGCVQQTYYTHFIASSCAQGCAVWRDTRLTRLWLIQPHELRNFFNLINTFCGRTASSSFLDTLRLFNFAPLHLHELELARLALPEEVHDCTLPNARAFFFWIEFQ